MSQENTQETLTCERCGTVTGRLYFISEENDDGEMITMKICWDCDHNVTNGGSLFDDVAEVLMDREENDYAYDPINTPKPEWMT